MSDEPPKNDIKDTFSQLNEVIAPNESTEISLDELITQRDEAEAKAKEYQDKFLRAKADMDNFHKRIEREIDNTRKFAVEKMIKELLPIMDSLEQGLQIAINSEDAFEAMHEGISLTLKMFTEVMMKFGVQVVAPTQEKYDPHFHEAMSMIAHPETPSGFVIEVIQKGYTLHGRVIRPARVIVAK
jgi:molecular chaperone GrpE